MMAAIESDRITADVDGDFVVFLIGMRINALWKVHKWIPVFRAMPRMLRERSTQDDAGSLTLRAIRITNGKRVRHELKTPNGFSACNTFSI